MRTMAAVLTMMSLSGLVWADTPASRPAASLKELVKTADVIVVIKALSTDPKTGQPIATSEGEKYQLIQILKTLKGQPPSQKYPWAYQANSRLADGKTYLLFSTRSGQAGLDEAIEQDILEATDNNVEMVNKEIKDQSPATRPTTRPVDASAAAELIRQLGNKDSALREKAARQLIGMGEAVIPILKSKLAEKDLDPQVASRIREVLEAPREGEPVREGGVDFQIVTAAVWVLPSGDEPSPVALALKITNHCDKPLQFHLYDTVTIHIKDANGKELRSTEAARDEGQLTNPKTTGKDQTDTLDVNVALKRTYNGFQLTGSDGMGGGWDFEGLKAGNYTVSLSYNSTQAKASVFGAAAGEFPFWIGKATTKELAVEIADKPKGTTRPAAK